MNFPHRKQAGFTLIEMIVSLGLFSVVITIATGALLALIFTNQQLQSEQSVMTNLSFALDSMTREIRSGTSYYCIRTDSTSNRFANPSYDLEDLDPSATNPCDDSRGSLRYQGIAFIEAGDSITGTGQDRIAYYYDEEEGTIYRKVGTESRSIVSSGIYISDFQLHASNLSRLVDDPNYSRQPIVTIRLEAKETDATSDKTYHIQTSITQRTLDI